MDMRKINQMESKLWRAKGRAIYQGKFCPCCCDAATPAAEARLVSKARRRLDKAIIEAELQDKWE
jgi:hypothetical protein